MASNFFFKKNKKIINEIFKEKKFKKNFTINSVCTLGKADKNDITFFDSLKYKQLAVKTKAGACITTSKLEKFIPNNIQKIIVKNVLLQLAEILKKVYPFADIDYPDMSLKKPNNTKYKSVKFGNNVLVGKNVKIGSNTIIGSNAIIEHDVKIGKIV